MNESTLSVLSYNILFPNTEGWWVYKYYPSSTPQHLSSWAHRRSLLLRQLKLSGADIICLQETAASSFQEDFASLSPKYTGLVHRRGMRMRCATLWRRDTLELVEERHSYRSLLTLFRLKGSPSPLLVINVHLSGGPQPKERLSQVAQALKEGQKLMKRYRASRLDQARSQVSPLHIEAPHVIMCGDYNENIEYGALREFLESGELSAGARARHPPYRVLSEKRKHHTFGPLRNALLETPHPPQWSRRAHLPWVSLRAEHLIGRFCEIPSGDLIEDAEVDSTVARYLADHVQSARDAGFDSFRRYIKPSMMSALRELFERFADRPIPTISELRMSSAGAERWLMTINGALRGSEHKAWISALNRETSELPQTALSTLTFAEWVEIPLRELYQGKWWSVAYDLSVCGVTLPEPTEGEPSYHREWIDHIVFSSALKPLSWCESPLFEELRRLDADERAIPHAEHPSDHFPVQAQFQILAPT